MEDYRQSEEYSQYLCNRGWRLEKLESTNILVKHLKFWGSVIKIQRGSPDISLDKLEFLAKKYHAIAVALEPDIKTEDTNYLALENSLQEFGYENFNYFFSPTKTTYIELKPSLEQILESFDRSIHRNLITNSENKTTFKIAQHIDEIYSLLNETGHKSDYYVQSIKNWKEQWEPFGDHIKVILAYQDNKLLGGNMIIIKPPTAYGLFLPITKLGRDSNTATLLIWEGIKIAKSKGCSRFDLNGMYDQRFNAPLKWKGLSEFKKKFNGHEVEFMHPKIKLFNRFLEPLQRLDLMWMFFMVR